jgi:hypothetical protein
LSIHSSQPPHPSRKGANTRTLKLIFTKPYQGVVVVHSNIPFHYRNCEFIAFPDKGYIPDERDSEMLKAILWKLLPTGFDNHSGVTEVHVKFLELIISHSLSIPSITIRDYVVYALPKHEEEYNHDPFLDSVD